MQHQPPEYQPPQLPSMGPPVSLLGLLAALWERIAGDDVDLSPPLVKDSWRPDIRHPSHNRNSMTKQVRE